MADLLPDSSLQPRPPIVNINHPSKSRLRSPLLRLHRGCLAKTFVSEFRVQTPVTGHGPGQDFSLLCRWRNGFSPLTSCEGEMRNVMWRLRMPPDGVQPLSASAFTACQVTLPASASHRSFSFWTFLNTLATYIKPPSFPLSTVKGGWV